LYSAAIRNAQALGDKNDLHDAVKNVSYQALFESFQSWRRCTAASSKRSVRDRESTAGTYCSFFNIFYAKVSSILYINKPEVK